MMNPSREQVAVALFTQLQTMGATFATYSRRPQLWDDTTAKPAIYQGQTLEQTGYSGDNTALPLHIMYFPITIYINTGLDPNTIPDTAINNLLDAVDACLAAPPYDPGNFTLGGKVAYARSEGDIIRIPGYLDGQGKVLFTIKALVPE